MRPRLPLLVVFVVLGGSLLLAGWMLADARRAAWDGAAIDSANLAQVLSHDIEQSIETYDLTLQSVQDGLRLPALAELPPEARRAALFDRIPASRYFGTVMVADPAGAVVLNAPGRVPAGLNLAEHDYFQAQQDNTDNGLLYVGHPFHGTPVAQDSIGLSRRLSTPDGGFAGVVAGSLQLAYFRDLFDEVRLRPGDSIVAVLTDGTPLVRVPADPRATARSRLDDALLTRMQGAPSGSFNGRGRLDGIERLYSYRKLGVLPVLLVVASPLDTVYADWRGRALLTGLVGLPLLAAAVLLGWTLSGEQAGRAAAERTAAERDAEFRATFDHAADGLFLLRVAAHGRFVLERANPALARLWGLPLAAMTGREPRSFLAAPLTAQMEQHWLACAESAGAVHYATATEQANRRLELETVVTPVHDADGRVTLLLGNIRDMTERAELTRQLAQAQRMEAVGQMTAGITHDFNNLLQTITFGVRELVAKSPDGEARKRLTAALRAVDRGVALTRRLLAFSRQQPVAPVVVDAGGMVAGLRELLAWSLGSKVQLQTVVGASLWPVQADQAQLEMCLLNLAANARDAMPNGGRLTIRVRNASAREATQNGLTVADHLVVCVQDSGKGMDATTRARVFEAFFTTKPVERGSGLGLWMVRGFARGAGGDVRIDSEPGKGTQVSLWLPRAAQDLVPATTTPDAGPGPAAPYQPDGYRREQGRILLVDDDHMVRAALSNLLEEAGHEVVAVAGSDDAIRLLRDAEPLDLLIADQSIPGLSGTELVAEASRQRPGLPAMVITGYARLEEIPPSVRVLHKPIDPDALLAEVAALISPATEVIGA